MIPMVFKEELKNEFYSPEGCFILEISNSENDPSVSIAKATVESGKQTKKHKLLGVTERYVIISGHGIMNLGTEQFSVKAGDVVLIPPGVTQSIYNNGPFNLVFYCVCTPRFTESCYISLDSD